MNSSFLGQYLKHRAKAFAGAFAAALTMAAFQGLETAFPQFKIDEASKIAAASAVAGFVTHQFVYWIENGPKEGTAP